jgi:PadR family transcriptional regulator PadR
MRIIYVMRRKPGELRPIEMDILEAGMRLQRSGVEEFHGFLVAKEMAEGQELKLLTAQGTLYRALNRLERDGLLESRWEDAGEAAQAGRPLRRLYRITAESVHAMERQRAAQTKHSGHSPRRAQHEPSPLPRH